jgi:hypothetical protein
MHPRISELGQVRAPRDAREEGRRGLASSISALFLDFLIYLLGRKEAG